MGSATDGSTEDDLDRNILYENVEMLDVDFNLSNFSDAELEEDPIDESTTLPAATSSPSKQSLYGCRLLAFVREFKGQSSGAHIAYWDVQATSVSDFKHKLWNLAKSHLLREIIFIQQDDGYTVPIWSEKDQPDEGDFGKFAIFYEKQNRKYTQLDKLTANLLHRWRGKVIHVLLHVYSLSVSSRKIFSTVKEHLIDPSNRDKSGAASTQVVVELSRELRSNHGERWDAHEIVWTMWASAILSSPAHLRESLKRSAPPEHLQHLFKAKDGTRIQHIKRGLVIAQNVNATFREEITAAKEAFLAAEVVEEELRMKMAHLKMRVEALEQRERLGESFLNAMETSVAVSNSDFSESIAAKVTDMVDELHE